VFDRSGKFLLQWGIAPTVPREGQGHLHFPASISISRSGGYAAVVEPLERRCQVFALGVARKPVPSKDLPFWDSAHARFHGNMIPVVQDGTPDGTSRWGRNPPVLAALLESEAHSVLFFDISLRPCYLLSRLGGLGRRLGEFREPAAIVADAASGTIVVNDRGNRRLQFLDLPRDEGRRTGFAPNARVIRSVDPVAGVPAGLEGYEPGRAFLEGMALDSAGNLYVADGANTAILEFDRATRFVRAIRLPRAASGPAHRFVDVALSPDGQRIYVLDQAAFQVVVFDAGGTLQFSWGRRGAGTEEEFLLPSGLAIDQEGSVYVADSGLQKIKKFDARGRPVTQWGEAAEQGPLSNPRSVRFIAPDRIIVDDDGNHRGVAFTRNGEFVVAFYKGGRSSPSGR
jgi:DNA-binding beta-propeller fold protein YncE